MNIDTHNELVALGNTLLPRTHYATVFSITIQSRLKIMSCHVQNFVTITLLEFEWK